jgi:hypothetical protein
MNFFDRFRKAPDEWKTELPAGLTQGTIVAACAMKNRILDSAL